MSSQEAYQSLYKRVRKAHFRHNTFLFLFSFLQSLFYCMLAAGVAAGILSLTPWAEFRYWTAAGILAVCVPLTIYLFLRRKDDMQVTALLTDKHLRLKEKITSALELGRIHSANPQEEEWHHALLTDALRDANRIDLKKAFPWQNPRETKWLWAPVLVLILTVFVLPQWDLLTRQALASVKTLEPTEVKKNMEDLMAKQLVFERRAQEEKNQEASQLSKEIRELSESLNKGKLEKREALAELSTMEKKWQERQEELQESMPALKRNLNPMDSKITSELAKAMQESDFKKAAEALQSLQQQLKTDSMSEADKDRLSDELKKLAESLKEGGSSLDPNSPLAKALENAAKGLKAGNLDSALKGLELAEMDMKDLQDLLMQMQMLTEAMEGLEETKCRLLGVCKLCGEKLGTCQGNCQGAGLYAGTSPWRPGDSRNQGAGMGGPGIGQGGKAPFEETDTGFTPDKVQSPFNEGPLQGMFSFKGQAQEGESNIAFKETVMQAQSSAEDALTREQIPITMRNHVRAYFHSLEEIQNGETHSEKN